MAEKESVLIVDDEFIIAIDIKQRLEAMGYEVLAIVNSGEKAIGQCRKQKPSIVLMDIIIKGDMDGIETSEIIRREFNTPVVFITASSDTLTLKKIMERGSFGYIHKPITDVDLKYTLQQSIKMYNTCNELDGWKLVSPLLAESIRDVVPLMSRPAFLLDENREIIAQSEFFGRGKFKNLNRILNKTGLNNDERIKIIELVENGTPPSKITDNRNRCCVVVPLDGMYYIEVK